MTTIKSINKIENINRSIVTIGNFDGLHKGHSVLIEKAVEYSKLNNISSVVFTFENHPANYFRTSSIKNIITSEEKINRLNFMGIDYIISVPFDEYMTKISASDFIKDILVDKLNVEKVIIGHDFSFAKNKEGNADLIQAFSYTYNFVVEIVKPIKINGIRVSSTHIRKLINEGKVSIVKDYLGYNYEIEGIVIHSKKLGRTIGFPTANVEVDEGMIIPQRGIYATKVYIDEEVYFGATNIGYNPTVKGQNLSIETNILEFDEDIYGKKIKVEFLERLRDEKKFSSLEELKIQLQKDTSYIYKKYVCKKEEYMIR